MRAFVELTPAEKRVLTTLTAEERQEVVTQMLESVREELEWQLAVESARAVAETVPAVVARVATPPAPASSGKYRWPSHPTRLAAAGGKR